MEPSLNTELHAQLSRCRQLKSAADRDSALGALVISLADKYIRRHHGSPDELSRVLDIVHVFATKVPAALGYGEPVSVGPIVIVLLERLVVPSAEEQDLVLRALHAVLRLLRACSARAFACVMRESGALLEQLPAAYTPGLANPLQAYSEFSRLCAGGARESTVQPAGLAAAALKVHSPRELEALRMGLLRLCASMHAEAAQFLGDGGPSVWRPLLDELSRRIRTASAISGVGAHEASGSAELGASPPSWQPPLQGLLEALRLLLSSHDSPSSLRSELQHQLLALLRIGLPSHPPQTRDAAEVILSGSRRLESRIDTDGRVHDVGLADIGVAMRPPGALLGGSCDDLAGDCIIRLFRPRFAARDITPPVASFPLLLHVLPWACAVSRSSRLLNALGGLWISLPTRLLVSHVAFLEPFLGVAHTQSVATACYIHALLAGERAEPLARPRSYAEGAGLVAAAFQRVHAAEPPSKRRCVSAGSGRASLLEHVRLLISSLELSLMGRSDVHAVAAADMSSAVALTRSACGALRVLIAVENRRASIGEQLCKDAITADGRETVADESETLRGIANDSEALLAGVGPEAAAPVHSSEAVGEVLFGDEAGVGCIAGSQRRESCKELLGATGLLSKVLSVVLHVFEPSEAQPELGFDADAEEGNAIAVARSDATQELLWVVLQTLADAFDPAWTPDSDARLLGGECPAFSSGDEVVSIATGADDLRASRSRIGVAPMFASELGVEVFHKCLRVAMVPWSLHALRLTAPRSLGAAACVAALRILVSLPGHASPDLRARAFLLALAPPAGAASSSDVGDHGGGESAGTSRPAGGCHENEAGEKGCLLVLVEALRLLPHLVPRLDADSTSACFEAVGHLLHIVSGGSLQQITTRLAWTIGRLACLQAGCCSDGALLCPFCDASEPSTSGRDRAGRDRACADDAAAAKKGAENSSSSRLFGLTPLLWSMLVRSSAQAGAIVDSHSRAEVVRSIARLARHAHPTELARARDVLHGLIGLLADAQPETGAACAECVPRLLAWPPFVRVVGGYSESHALNGHELRRKVLRPMVSAMRDVTSDQTLLCMMQVLGALGREPLYAADIESKALIVLALCERLGAVEMSLEYECAMQELRAIAACTECGGDVHSELDRTRPAATAAAEDRVQLRAHAEASATSKVAATDVRASEWQLEEGSSLERLYLQLAPHLSREWVWWLDERPHLLQPIASRLLDCSQSELLRRALPHALPSVVLLGGLAKSDARNETEMTSGSAASRVLGNRWLSRGQAASAVLNEIATQLGCTTAALLIEHMHLILVELFVQQASDDTGELNAAIPGGLEFLFAHGIDRAEGLADMIRMNADQLLQELTLRLGRAQTEDETRVVLMALNLLIPIGLQVGREETSSALQNSLAENSCALQDSNATLRAYIDANFHMLVQFLRDRMVSTSLPLRENKEALHALLQILDVMKSGEVAVSHAWWGEIVATLKRVLVEPQLQRQALCVLQRFVRLMDSEMLAHGMQQLFLMILPCLQEHQRLVVSITETLVVDPHEKGCVSEHLAQALSEVTYLPEHPALAHVSKVLREHYVCDGGLRLHLRSAVRFMQHEASAVRLMALQQLLELLRRTSRSELRQLLLCSSAADSDIVAGLVRELLRFCRQANGATSSTTQQELDDALDLALLCLSEIGALDSARLTSSSNADAPRDSASALHADLRCRPARFRVFLSDAELCVLLVEEFLVKSLRDASDGQVVQSAAYAIGILLRRVCGCTAETPGQLHILSEQHKSAAAGKSSTLAWVQLSERQRHALKMWGSLSESTRRTIRPYLTLSAESRSSAAVNMSSLTSLYTTGMRQQDWIIRWCRQLLQLVAHLKAETLLASRETPRAELLLACEPFVRFSSQLALQLLPYLIELLLRVSDMDETPISNEMIINEMIHVLSQDSTPAERQTQLDDSLRPQQWAIAAAGAAEHSLCCHAVFSLLDSFDEWISQLQAREKRSQQARLQKFVRQVPHQALIRAALLSGAHCRALSYAERLADESNYPSPEHFLRPAWQGRKLPAEACSLVHRAYSATDEPDGLLGLAAMRTRVCHASHEDELGQQVLEHELQGRYAAALCCYELGHMHHAAQPEWQLGKCRCLRYLGLYSAMKESAESSMLSWPKAHQRLPIGACAVQAAWRLGQWGDVQRLLLVFPQQSSDHSPGLGGHSSSDACFELELARALLALRHDDMPQLSSRCRAARRALVPLLASAGVESYSHAYPHLVRLQLLQELEAAATLLAPDLTAKDAKLPALADLMQHWSLRLQLMSKSVPSLEPLLALRCAVSDELLRRSVDSALPALAAVARQSLGRAWLHFARCARVTGNLETAANAVMQARLHDRFGATRLAAKMDWEAGRTHHAILQLHQQRVMLQACDSEESESLAEEAALTTLQLARYMAQTGEAEGDELGRMFEAAVTHLDSEKCHYWLGHFHDEQLRKALAKAALKEVEVRATAPMMMSCPAKRAVTCREREHKALEAFVRHLPLVIGCYGDALRRGTKHAQSSLPRILSLWLEYTDLHDKHERSKAQREPHDVMVQLSMELPISMWLPCVAQLVSRICHRSALARELLHKLLARLLAGFPRVLVWSVTPSSLSDVPNRKRFGETVVGLAKQMLVGSSAAQEVLKSAAKLIDQLRRVCNDQSIDKHEKQVSMRARWTSLYKLKDLQMVVPVYANLTAADQSSSSLEAYQPFASDAPRISGWEDRVDVMGSLQRPKKIIVKGSNDRQYAFLCKPKDDLRKDARIMDFMTSVNRLLHKSINCRRRQLAVRCYAVTPLDEECGLIEWVPNMLQLRSIIKGYWDSRRLNFSHTDIKSRHTKAAASGEHRSAHLRILIKQLMQDLPPVLQHWFVDNFREPSAWFEARLVYTRSCAAMSMIGFAVGLGDRHLENILIDETTGSLMHVDFACLFDHGLNLATPERVPFRLTQNLVHAMGVCGGEGVFRRVSELTLEQLRGNRETLLNVLNTMRHDPLVEWRKRNTNEDASGERDSEEAEKEMAKIDLKLQGVLQAHGVHPLSVQGQVQQLINDATDLSNLAEMYIWWMPWA